MYTLDAQHIRGCHFLSLYIRRKYCIDGQSFTDLLGVLSVAFPHINLPKKYYEVKKIIRGLGLDYEKIHACPKDCMLFRGERANQESCHVC